MLILRTFYISIRSKGGNIFSVATLGIQCGRNLLRLLLTEEIIEDSFKSNINLTDTAYIIIAVVMIVNSNKSHTHKKKYLLDIFSLLNVIFGKSGEILHDNTANGRNSFELLVNVKSCALAN